MSQQDTATTTVRQSVTVDVPVDKAFAVFTDDMNSWWPPEHHIIEGPITDMVVEPRAGGTITSHNAKGDTCAFARVLAYDPPGRLVFSWDLTPQFAIETDQAKTSEVDVQFIAEGDSRTRVEIEHRHIDRHGEGWEGLREAVSSEGGWPLTLNNFAARIAG